MKRTLTLVLALVILCLPLTLSISAAETEDTMLTDVLKETNRDLIADILSSGQFDSDFQLENAEEKPLLLVFRTPLHQYFRESSYADMLSQAQSEHCSQIVVLNQNTFHIRAYQEIGENSTQSAFDSGATYIQDIINGKAQQVFLGQSCSIRNVICYSGDGTTVVYETDKGIFVRYYTDSTASAMEFSWDDYIGYADSYFEYISSYGANYSGIGTPLSGKTSFRMYITDPARYPVVTLWDRLAPFVIGFGGIIVVLVAVSLLLKKRREKRFAQKSQ